MEKKKKPLTKEERGVLYRTEKVIAVYNTEGRYLSHCSRRRAKQLTIRKKAVWRGTDQITLLFNKREARKFREEVRRRDGNKCYICEQELTESEMTFDHLTPRRRGGTDFVDNQAICCDDCNGDKGNLTPEEYTLLLYARVLLTLGGHYERKRRYIRTTSSSASASGSGLRMSELR